MQINGHRWEKIPIYVGFENEKRNDKMREGRKSTLANNNAY